MGWLAFSKMPSFVSHIKSKNHRMSKSEKFAELTISRVIKAVQGHFYSILEISLEKRFPICIGTVNY